MSTRIFYLLTLVFAVLLAIGLPAHSIAATPPSQAGGTGEVLRALSAAPDGRGEFALVMRERIQGDVTSTIDAQMTLEPVLETLRSSGLISAYITHYGQNRIYVNGSAPAARFLADWPEVAALEPAEAQLQMLPAAAQTGSEHISGTVTGPGGAGLAGITVRAYQQTSPIDWTVAGEVGTGTNGTYDIGNLAAGVYVVKFEDTGGAYVTEFYNDARDFEHATRFNVPLPAGTQINATLAAAGKISGTVTAGGSPAGNVTVKAWADIGGTWYIIGSVGSRTDDGGYTIGGLAAGSYRLEFTDFYLRYTTEWWDNKPTRDTATPITVTAGATAGGKNADLGGNGSINGRVTGPDGATPLKDIDVSAWQWNTTYSYWEDITRTVSGGDGSYSITVLGGVYRISFRDPLNPPYAQQEYYNDKPDVASGTNVQAWSDGTPTNGINASLTLYALPPAPVVTLTRDGANAKLTWPPITTDTAGKPVTIQRYEVWYSASAYFDIGGPGATRVIPPVPDTPSYTDPNALMTAGGRFYLVRALTDRGGYSPASNRTGKFGFTLVKGTP